MSVERWAMEYVTVWYSIDENGRGVFGLPLYHSYLVYSPDSGPEQAIRGGITPYSANFWSTFGDIVVVHGTYDPSFIDYDIQFNDLSITVAEGAHPNAHDCLVQGQMSKVWNSKPLMLPRRRFPASTSILRRQARRCIDKTQDNPGKIPLTFQVFCTLSCWIPP